MGRGFGCCSKWLGKVGLQLSNGTGVPSYYVSPSAGRIAPVPAPALLVRTAKQDPFCQLCSPPAWESFLLLCSLSDELSCVRAQPAWRQAGWLASWLSFAAGSSVLPPDVSPQTHEEAGSKEPGGVQGEVSQGTAGLLKDQLNQLGKSQRNNVMTEGGGKTPINSYLGGSQRIGCGLARLQQLSKYKEGEKQAHL